MTFEGKEVDWAEEFNGAVTVCDKEGIIVYMNQYSIHQYIDERAGEVQHQRDDQPG